MRAPGYIFCTTGPAVVWRLKVDVLARRAVIPSDIWSDAVEEALRVIEHGGNLTERHRGIIEGAIAGDAAVGLGPMGSDLMELLSLVDTRQRGDTIEPPACTREQLLTVSCPTCGAMAGSYCELRPGKVLLLPQHHAARFWAARGTSGAVN